jgi:hypothetical protein
MELPIKVIAVLFVTLIVAVMVIQFSRDIITSSQYKLEGIFDGTDKDKILQLNTATASQIAYLAEECYSHGTKNVPYTEICFAARIDTPLSVSGSDIQNEWVAMGQDAANIDISGYSSGSKGLFIYYTRPVVEIKT